MGDLQLLAGALFLGVPEKPCTSKGQSRRRIWVLKEPHSLGGTHHPKGRGSLNVSGFPPSWGKSHRMGSRKSTRRGRKAGTTASRRSSLPDPRLPKPTAGREQPRAVARQPAPSPALAGVAHSDARRAWCTAGPRGVLLLAAGWLRRLETRPHGPGWSTTWPPGPQPPGLAACRGRGWATAWRCAVG